MDSENEDMYPNAILIADLQQNVLLLFNFNSINLSALIFHFFLLFSILFHK